MPDETKTLYTREQVQEKVQELAEKIATDYKGKKPVLIGILNGAFIVMADLTRALYEKGLTDVEVGFMSVSSYGTGTQYSGETKVVQDIKKEITGKDVLVVEDIVDTGHTLTFIKKHLEGKNPASLKILAFLDKKEKREVEVSVDYIGFTIQGTPWIEGYGLDGGEFGRGRPSIAEKILS
jgi:hypoxanthine phosphoribosyltransferase